MPDLEDDIETLEGALQSFAQTMKRPQRWNKVIAEAGVSLDRPAAMVLQTLLIHQSKRLRVQDVALHLGIESPSVTRKTQELEQAGFIRRRSDPSDRRAIRLEVTAAGRRAGNHLSKAHRHIIETVLETWPVQDRRQFVKLFERFSQDLGVAANDEINKERTTRGRNHRNRITN